MIKVKEKIILDKEQQKIIAELDKTIDRLEKQNKEMANIEKQHQYMNGELHKEVSKLKKENEYLKKENVIIREGNEHLKIYRTNLVDVLEIALTHEPKRDGYKIELNELTEKGPKNIYKVSCNGVPTYRNIIDFKK
ncbi:hypothetical protein ACIJYB_03760 [Candidatus Pelagibacter bacterium nBUS_44]|uniref:hypothetical protein n=1 Tax=Candidatus Pelagibacter bacterium nBUS_44 TaxID=3374195 RepID=UPI003EBF69C0